jgi:ribosome-associated translation inhibitor RaiA
MEIEIRTRGFSLTPALRAHAGRRLALAAVPHRDRISRARLVVSGVKGAKGADRTRCSVEVRLRGGVAVRATALDADAERAIAAATRRAGRALDRAVERERETILELLWLVRAVSGPRRAA